MVGLARQIGGDLVVDAVLDEGRIAHVTPEHGRHPELVCLMEGSGNLLDLPVGLR